MCSTSASATEKRGFLVVRGIAGVIVGYIAMFLFLFVAFSVAYLAMGQDLAFRPESYEPSVLWIAVSFTLGLPAAILGGLVCVQISRSVKAGKILAAVVFVIGIISAVPVVLASGEPAAVRSGDVSSMEAMMKAKQPVLVAVINPFLGALGVSIGTRLRRRT
jgi:hypothetical protein